MSEINSSDKNQDFVAPVIDSVPGMTPHIDDVPVLRAGERVVTMRPGDPGYENRFAALSQNIDLQNAAHDSLMPPADVPPTAHQ